MSPEIQTEIARLTIDLDGKDERHQWLAEKLRSIKTPVHWKLGKLPLNEIWALATDATLDDRLLTYRGILPETTGKTREQLERLIASTEGVLASERDLKRMFSERST